MPSVRSVSTGSGTTSPAVVTNPAGTVDGDIVLIQIATDDFGASADVPAPAGFVRNTDDIAVARHEAYTFSRKLSGDGASWSFPITGVATHAWACAAIQDGLAVDQVAGINTPLGSTHDTPTITPSVGGCLIVSFFSIDRSSADTPAPGTWTILGFDELWDFEESAQLINMAAYSEVQAVAAAISEQAIYGSTAREGVSAIYAISPSGGVTPTPSVNPDQRAHPKFILAGRSPV